MTQAATSGGTIHVLSSFSLKQQLVTILFLYVKAPVSKTSVSLSWRNMDSRVGRRYFTLDDSRDIASLSTDSFVILTSHALFYVFLILAYILF
jgi:hypothetical protein